MNTKDILLFGAGVLLSYLLVNFFKEKNTDEKNTVESVLPTQKIMDICNKQVAEKLKTVKLSSAEALEEFKKTTYADCIANLL